MNSGSFFFAEIMRMTSSLNPQGIVSASTSVTKPYLYSWLARASIAFVDVLIVSPQVGRSTPPRHELSDHQHRFARGGTGTGVGGTDPGGQLARHLVEGPADRRVGGFQGDRPARIALGADPGRQGDLPQERDS